MQQHQVKLKKWRAPNWGSVLGPLEALNYEIADSTASCCADDARILLGIKDEEDTQILQNDLQKLSCINGYIQII